MMQNRPVSSRDYCEKASPDVAILKKKKVRKKENEGGKEIEKKHTQLEKKMGGNGVRFHIFLSYNNSKENL